jgi:hypothetical protein
MRFVLIELVLNGDKNIAIPMHNMTSQSKYREITFCSIWLKMSWNVENIIGNSIVMGPKSVGHLVRPVEVKERSQVAALTRFETPPKKSECPCERHFISRRSLKSCSL